MNRFAIVRRSLEITGAQRRFMIVTSLYRSELSLRFKSETDPSVRPGLPLVGGSLSRLIFTVFEAVLGGFYVVFDDL